VSTGNTQRLLMSLMIRSRLKNLSLWDHGRTQNGFAWSDSTI